MTKEQALLIAVNGRDLKFSICPWQTLRRLTTDQGKRVVMWQLDLLLTAEDMTKYNPVNMSMDLQRMYYGHRILSAVMTLPKLFPFVNEHTSAGVWPIFTKFDYVSPKEGVTHDLLDLGRGWVYQKVDKAWDFLTAVREEKDGTFELSGCMFAVEK